MANNSCAGMVYSMTNSENNQVIAFCTSADGRILSEKAYETGGSGTGEQKIDPLSSQNSIIISKNKKFLFNVNAGDNSISSYFIAADGTPNLIGIKPSGGIKPNSLAEYNNNLYVTNSGNPSNITGFTISESGILNQFTTSPLSSDNAQPSCITVAGSKLAVSELNTNRISVYNVNGNGTLEGPTVNNSSGGGPFGSVFLNKGFLLVTEAGTNALSSYTLNSNGTLTTISGSVRNFQLATCWVSTSMGENYAYTSNAGSRNITIYLIRQNGTLSMMGNVKSTSDGTGAPLDSGVNNKSNMLYVLNGNQGSISVFRIMGNGMLNLIQVAKDTMLPEMGAQGLAVL